MCTLMVLFDGIWSEMGYVMVAATDERTGMWIKGPGTDTRHTW
jgi:hypothetical protein